MCIALVLEGGEETQACASRGYMFLTGTTGTDRSLYYYYYYYFS